MGTYLLWFDFETTGLEVIQPNGKPGADYVVEVGWLVTELNLTPIDEPKSVLVDCALVTEHLRAISPSIVQEMHDKSGLWADHRDAWLHNELRPLTQIQQTIVNQLERLPVGSTFVLAGSGVSTFDYPIIKAFMPNLERRLAYYTFDVSNVERFMQAAVLGEMRSTSKAAEHRVIADIEHSIMMARVMSAIIDHAQLHGFIRGAFPKWFEGGLG